MNLHRWVRALLAMGCLVYGISAAPAAATVVTTSEGSLYTSAINAKAVGSVTLEGATTVTCKASSLESSVSSHGNAVTAEAKVSSMSFSECGASDVSVETPGSLIVHATSGDSGTVTSSGLKIKVQFTALGLTCVYSTSSTDVGTLTGSISTLGSAGLDVNSAGISRTEGSVLCGASGTLKGSYEVTTPSVLFVTPEAQNGVALTVPKQVNFSKEGDKQPVKVENSGTVNIKNLEVQLGKPNSELWFSPTETCKVVATFNVGASCTETIECKAKAKGKAGRLFSSSLNPPVVATTELQC